MWNLERRYKDADFTEWQFMSKHEDESSARMALWVAEEKHEQRSRYKRGEIFVYRVIDKSNFGLIADRPRS